MKAKHHLRSVLLGIWVKCYLNPMNWNYSKSSSPPSSCIGQAWPDTTSLQNQQSACL